MAEDYVKIGSYTKRKDSFGIGVRDTAISSLGDILNYPNIVIIFFIMLILPTLSVIISLRLFPDLMIKIAALQASPINLSELPILKSVLILAATFVVSFVYTTILAIPVTAWVRRVKNPHSYEISGVMINKIHCALAIKFWKLIFIAFTFFFLTAAGAGIIFGLLAGSIIALLFLSLLMFVLHTIIFLRLCMALPPTALGEKMSILTAWRLSSGYGFMMFLSSLIITIMVSLIFFILKTLLMFILGGLLEKYQILFYFSSVSFGSLPPAIILLCNISIITRFYSYIVVDEKSSLNKKAAPVLRSAAHRNTAPSELPASQTRAKSPRDRGKEFKELL